MEGLLIEKDFKKLLSEHSDCKANYKPINELWSAFIKEHVTQNEADYYERSFLISNNQDQTLENRLVFLNNEIKFDIILDCLYNVGFWQARNEKSPDVDVLHQQDLEKLIKNCKSIVNGKKKPNYYIPIIPTEERRPEDTGAVTHLLNFHLQEYYSLLDNKDTFFSIPKNMKIDTNSADGRFSQEKVLELKAINASNLESYYIFESITSYFLCKSADDALEVIYRNNSEEEYYSILGIIKTMISLFKNLPFKYGRTAMLLSFIESLDKGYDCKTIDYYKYIINTAENLSSPNFEADYNDLRKKFLAYLLNEYYRRNTGEYICKLYSNLNEYVSKEQYYKIIFTKYNESPYRAAKTSKSYKRYIALQQQCFYNMPKEQQKE